MLTRGLFVVVATFLGLVTTPVGSTTSQCYVGTLETRTLMGCTEQHSRPKRQSIITSPMISVNTEDPKTNVDTTTLSTPPEIATLNWSLPNTTITISPRVQPTLKPDPVSTAGPRRRQSCLTFVAQNKSFANDGIFYDCDYGGLCTNVDSQEATKITYKGYSGVVHCCRGIGCNSDYNSTFPVSKQTLKCFQGTNETSAVCPSSGWVCVNSTRTSEVTNFVAVAYGCQPLNDSTCNGSSKSVCNKLLTPAGQNVTSCCCTTDHCNAPPPIAQVASNAIEDALLESFESIKWVVYGCVMVVSACILAVTVTIFYKRWRRRLEIDYSDGIISNPRFQRLAANFTAGDTDDVKMLLAEPEC